MSEVIPGVWSPMDQVSSWDPLQGGYSYLAKTDNGATFHPGSDLNAGNGGDADLGLPLRMPVGGVPVYVRQWDGRTSGYGAHCWLALETGDYLHYCHCLSINALLGVYYPAGMQVAAVGKSGFQTWAHLHLEVKREDPALAGYEYWPYGKSEAYVREHYVRPLTWWNELLAAYAQRPEVDVSILNETQQAAVQAAVWGDYWNRDAADFALPASWREEWKAGRWRGRPRGGEQLLPASDGGQGGSFQEFEAGCCVWLPGQEASWTG